MTTPHPQGRGLADELTNTMMIGLAATFGIALVLRAAGSAAALRTGLPQPKVGIAGGVNVLFDPIHPAAALQAESLNAIVYWVVAAAFLLALEGAIG